MRVRHFLVRCLLACLVAGVPSGRGRAKDLENERRIALVIGNANYAHVEHLANPINDAKRMAKLFQDAGFETVQSYVDLDIGAFRHRLADFEILAKKAGVAVIYYSGHGIEYGGENYLVPVDAAIRREVDVQDEAVTLDRMLRAVDGASRLRLIILDSCRTDPFTALSHDRSAHRGLVRVEPDEANELVAYAAKAGTVARDGPDGDNSPYTKALLKRLTTPGLDVELALRQVRDDVLSDTDNQQEPYYYGSMGGGLVTLGPAATKAAPTEVADRPREPVPSPALPSAPAPPAGPAPGEATAGDVLAWAKLATTDQPQALRGFVRDFPQSNLRGQAVARLESLDDAAWARAAAGDLPAIGSYLDAFPDGRHRNEARARLAVLEVPKAISAPGVDGAEAARPEPARRSEHLLRRAPERPHRRDDGAERRRRAADRSVARAATREPRRDHHSARKCFSVGDRDYCE